jgi:hypothetical protein
LFNSELGKLSTDWALEEAQLYKSKTKIPIYNVLVIMHHAMMVYAHEYMYKVQGEKLHIFVTYIILVYREMCK